MDYLKLQNRDLCRILLDATTADICIELLVQKLNESHNLDEDESKLVKERLNKYFMPKFRDKWKKSFYSVEKFFSLQCNQKWLDQYSEILFQPHFKDNAKRRKSFESASAKTKKRRSEELNKMFSKEEIECAFFEMLTASGKKKVIPLIKKIISSDYNSEPEEELKSFSKLSNDEALALLIDSDLTKAQYNLIREKAKEKDADIFPPYNNVLSAKKDCYPVESSRTVTETCVSTELQALLDHTIQRLFKIPQVTIDESIKKEVDKILLVTKWGGDGTSGFNEYKQKFTNNENSDKYLFLLSMVPLYLKAVLKDATEVSIWENPRTSSTNFCRPIKFEFVQETKERVSFEFGNIKEKIQNLSCTKIEKNGETILVRHELHCTMIDGKVCQYVTDTSASSVCPICHCSPKEMNKLELIKAKTVDVTVYQFGLSTLHKWIRCMECVLHVSYRLEFKRWTTTGNNKALFNESKRRIQSELRNELGLIVDVPKQGSGTSNDGNTARIFFQNYEIVSKITGFDEDLLKRIYVLLQTTASGKYIDVVRFREYANTTARLFVTKYPWYYMPVALHVMLIHGADIISSFVLPIGWMSEEPQESRNKDIKRCRTEHTRKTSRVDTNTDLHNFLLVSSDPYLASLRKKSKKKEKMLHEEAVKLLSEREQKFIIV